MADDLDKALSSRRFATKIEALSSSGAKELMYVKLNHYLQRTTKLLGLDSDQIAVGYASKAKSAAERVNKPLIGSIFQGIGSDDVKGYVDTLFALPTVRKDKDYMQVAGGLIRACKTLGQIKQDYPGYEEAWNEFFDKDLKGVFTGLPNVVTDPDRKVLFEALSSIVTGEVPAELSRYQDDLDTVHEAFYQGDTETLANGLFGITSALVKLPPPAPPGTGGTAGADAGGDQDGGGEHPAGGARPPSTTASGSSGQQPTSLGGGEDDDEAEGEQDPSITAGQTEDDAPGEETEGEDAAGEVPDPFGELGRYLSSLDDSAADPDDLDAVGRFEPPGPPEDIDLDRASLMDAVCADIGLPAVFDGTAYVYLETPAPPGAGELYRALLNAYRAEAKEVQRIIHECYRTAMLAQRGLTAGRVDQARIYRAAFDQQDVFRRDHLGSVGHLDLVVLVDESGSMSATDGAEGFRGLNLGTPCQHGSDEEVLFGRAHSEIKMNRANVARVMAMLLLEASRKLSGFKVRVAGYSTVGGHELGPLASVGEAVQSILNDKGKDHFGVPLVRKLGDPANPLPVMTVNPFSSNADAEGLAWALEQLARSSAPQKAILYLADGHVDDCEDTVAELLAKARRLGVYTYFMNLSGRPYPGGALAKLDAQLVSSFKDLMTGLRNFLTNVVRQVRR